MCPSLPILNILYTECRQAKGSQQFLHVPRKCSLEKNGTFLKGQLLGLLYLLALKKKPVILFIGHI